MDGNKTEFYCNKCNYTTHIKGNWNKHRKSVKHYLNTCSKFPFENKIEVGESKICSCGKKYKHQSSYYRHIKKCPVVKKIESDNTISKEDLMVELLKTNHERLKDKDKLIEALNTANTTTNNITNNSNTTNNSININIFLNETCKDALNLTDFIENIKLTIEDLMYSKEHGYVKGLSNVLIKNLTDISPTQRPVHCSDIKRKQFYVKDNDIWEKDNDNVKMSKSIDNLTGKQGMVLNDWILKNPDYQDNKKKEEDFFIMAKLQAGGTTYAELDKNKQKIIKNLTLQTNIKGAIESSVENKDDSNDE
tara:strand:+ start:222 stop:1139 length:918 start_codon:yes stop_codon:yes gene_type:complete